MRLVIEIDENVFTRLFDNGTEDYEIVNDDLFAIVKSIRNGTPLPKGYGRLIDAERYRNEMFNSREFDFFKTLDMQPTIIESEKEDKK